MKNFFKLTKAKIILSIILAFTLLIFSLSRSYIGLSNCSVGSLPILIEGPTPTPIPANFSDTMNYFSQIIAAGNDYCPPTNVSNPNEYTPSYNIAYDTAQIIIFILAFFIVYLIAGILNFFFSKEVKNKTNENKKEED